jgi:cupin fold WbuC family metalloprotein
MSLSTISLLAPDPAKLREDEGAKSVSFFCIERPVRVDKVLLGEMKEVSEKRGGRNVRICLHSAPADEHHDMVVLERAGNYYPPHKHAAKGECFHVMEGRLGLLAFDETGAVVDATALAAGDVYRIAVGMYHAVMPLSDPVIYHESKPGPFLGQGDSIYPDWAPVAEDAEAVTAFQKMALSKLSR